MKIKLVANPPDAPGYCKLVAEDGRVHLIQSDAQFCNIARLFGFKREEVVNAFAPRCQHKEAFSAGECPDCGFPAGNFIHAARTYLTAHDGAVREDRAYFDPVPSFYEELPGHGWRKKLSQRNFRLAERFDSIFPIPQARFLEIIACDELADQIAAGVLKQIQHAARQKHRGKRVRSKKQIVLELVIARLNESSRPQLAY